MRRQSQRHLRQARCLSRKRGLVKVDALVCLTVPRTLLPVWVLGLRQVLARVFVRELLLERVLVRLQALYPTVRVWKPLLLPVQSLLRLPALVFQGCRRRRNSRAWRLEEGASRWATGVSHTHVARRGQRSFRDGRSRDPLLSVASPGAHRSPKAPERGAVKAWQQTLFENALRSAILRGSLPPLKLWNVACFWTKLSVACIRSD